MISLSRPSPILRNSIFPFYFIWILLISLSFGCQKDSSDGEKRPAGIYLESIYSENLILSKNYTYNSDGTLLKIENGFRLFYYAQDKGSQVIEGHDQLRGPQEYYMLLFKNGRLSRAAHNYKYYVYYPQRSVRSKELNEEFYYDDSGRLNYSMSGPVKASFTLDDRGNILRISRRNIETNEFIEAFSFEYDTAHNPLYHFEPSHLFELAYYTASVNHFLYFSPNNLLAFHKIIDNGQDSVSTYFRYQYNAQNFPISKTILPDSGSYAVPNTSYYFYKEY